MAEATVLVPDTGTKKAHFWDRVIGANTVLDEFVLPGEYPYASYFVQAFNISVATANDHILCVNAGATLPVRVRRIVIEQATNATAGATDSFEIRRTTTAAPTGGTAVTPAPHDTTDAAAGAAGRTLPGVKGTESTVLFTRTLTMRQTVAASGSQQNDKVEWIECPRCKPVIIPAGTANGLVIKNIVATAGGTVNALFEIVETNFV